MSDRILLQYQIEQEIAQREYVIPPEDRKTLAEMLDEINQTTGTDFHYLAELDLLSAKGAGETIKKYTSRFKSEFVKSILLQHLVDDRVKDCALIIYQMYLQFKKSEQYVSAPLAIYVRYDNAFKRLKPKRLREELLALAYNPRDVLYLPLTMGMLASWKIPALEALFTSYAESERITPESLDLSPVLGDSQTALSKIRRDLKFTAIECLRYYPSSNTVKLLESYTKDADRDIRAAAENTLRYIANHS